MMLLATGTRRNLRSRPEHTESKLYASGRRLPSLGAKTISATISAAVGEQSTMRAVPAWRWG